MKQIIKDIIKKFPIGLTKNHSYDLQSKRVIRKVCRKNSNCIDIGCHKGEVLDFMLKAAPEGSHFGFEPLPVLFEDLVLKYAGRQKIHLFKIALSNSKGEASFNYVVSNPSYSGLQKRQYDRAEKDTRITVQTEKLDDIIPPEVNIHLMKIDVEGGELLVLEGAGELIRKHKPVVIFEHGLGASEFYNSSPDKVHGFFQERGLKVSLMSRWLKGQESLSRQAFEVQFHKKLNYYFIAYP